MSTSHAKGKALEEEHDCIRIMKKKFGHRLMVRATETGGG
jgi:hypothetical protein